MKPKKVEFTRERLSLIECVSKDYIQSLDFQIANSGDDFVNETFTMRLDAYFLTNTADERTLTYYCPRPTFFDWLFRRRKDIKWKLYVKDILINPPKLKDRTHRIYLIDRVG